MLQEVERVPGIADARIQQAFDYPEFDVAVDRTKAAQGGYTQRDVANSLLNSLSGSFQITPMFFLNWKNGVSYNLVTQTPQYSIQSLQDLQNTPLNASPRRARKFSPMSLPSPERNEMEVINHYNIRRIVDIYAAVQGRDLGAVGRESRALWVPTKVPAARQLRGRQGQLQTMRTSYLGLLGGLVFFRRSRLSPDRRQLSVLARSFHHHHRASGRAAASSVSCSNTYNSQRARLDGRDHVHGCRNSEQYSRRVLCEKNGSCTTEIRSKRHRSRLHPVSPGAHDRTGDDHWNDSYGARLGEGGEQMPRWARGHWRTVVRHRGYSDLRPAVFSLLHRRRDSFGCPTRSHARF